MRQAHLAALTAIVIAVTAVSLGASSAPETLIEQRAGQFYHDHDLQSATAELQRGVKEYPDSAQIHFMLGNAYLRAQRWESAAAEYRKALQLRPNHPDTPLNLGFAYYRAGRRDQAVAAWYEAVRQSPHDALPAVSLALGLHADGHEHEARECMIQTIHLDPEWKRRVSRDFRWSPDMQREVDRLAASVVGGMEPASQHS